MEIKFAKMQSMGNDFVVIDAIRQAVNLSVGDIRKMANRRLGIGFDQLLLLEPATQAHCDFKYRIFNADGTEVGQCGNGARCLGRFIAINHLSDKTEWLLETITTQIKVDLVENDVRVTMPVPNFLPNLEGAIAALDIGNPHLVFQVADVDELDLFQAAAPYVQHPAFPEGVNIGFMQILNPAHIRLRVYERGAGATLACGSGACAAMIAGRAQGILDEEVRVDQLGGSCVVQWKTQEDPAYLRGSAELCFTGIWMQ